MRVKIHNINQNSETQPVPGTKQQDGRRLLMTRPWHSKAEEQEHQRFTPKVSRGLSYEVNLSMAAPVGRTDFPQISTLDNSNRFP